MRNGATLVRRRAESGGQCYQSSSFPPEQSQQQTLVDEDCVGRLLSLPRHGRVGTGVEDRHSGAVRQRVVRICVDLNLVAEGLGTLSSAGGCVTGQQRLNHPPRSSTGTRLKAGVPLSGSLWGRINTLASG